MTWTAKIRNASGALEDLTLEAPSRAAAFEELKKRGIAPLSLAEGGTLRPNAPNPKSNNQPIKQSNNSHSPTSAPSPNKGLVAGLVVVILGLVAVWFLRSGNEPVAEEKAPIKAPVKIADVNPVGQAATNRVVTVEVNTSPTTPRLSYLKDLSPEERRRELDKLHLEKKLDLSVRTNGTFSTGTEQVIDWIFSTEVGALPPLLPPLPPCELVHLKAILDHQNTIAASDSEKVAEAKDTVDFAKKELKKFMENGGTADEFLKYYHGQLQQAFQYRETVKAQLYKIVREEPEIAREYEKELNADLERRGIKKVLIPERMATRFGVSK